MQSVTKHFEFLRGDKKKLSYTGRNNRYTNHTIIQLSFLHAYILVRFSDLEFYVVISEQLFKL